MFVTLDAAAGVPNGRPKSAADRACDQCKSRKVRCDMNNPCGTCVNRNLTCTYNQDRKKRGPTSGRISKIQRLQQKNGIDGVVEGILDFRATATSSSPSTHSGLRSSDRGGEGEPTRELGDMRSIFADDQSMAHSHHSAPYDLWPSTGSPALSMHPDTPSPHKVSVSLPLSTGLEQAQAPLALTPSQASQVSGDSAAAGILLPSLPLDSPSDSLDLFASIAAQDLLPISGTVEFWPQSISQEAMLPWIDVYFKRLHPTVPVLSRAKIYQEMLLRRHHHDPQFGAMLLALCAFAMTQPVQIHEIDSTPSRSVQVRMLLEESVKMRTTIDFGENPTIHMILASFFIFACLFGCSLHKAAYHRLREAIDLAKSLSMHLPQAYDGLDPETREQWLRTYLVLSVTERLVHLLHIHARPTQRES